MSDVNRENSCRMCPSRLNRNNEFFQDFIGGNSCTHSTNVVVLICLSSNYFQFLGVFSCRSDTQSNNWNSSTARVKTSDEGKHGAVDPRQGCTDPLLCTARGATVGPNCFVSVSRSKHLTSFNSQNSARRPPESMTFLSTLSLCVYLLPLQLWYGGEPKKYISINQFQNMWRIHAVYENSSIHSIWTLY